MPLALADWEGVDHKVIEGAWRRDGLGALRPVEPRTACNPTTNAKQQHDLLR